MPFTVKGGEVVHYPVNGWPTRPRDVKPPSGERILPWSSYGHPFQKPAVSGDLIPVGNIPQSGKVNLESKTKTKCPCDFETIDTLFSRSQD